MFFYDSSTEPIYFLKKPLSGRFNWPAMKLNSLQKAEAPTLSDIFDRLRLISCIEQANGDVFNMLAYILVE